MRVAAISDLHIGARVHTDGFRHDLARFEGWLSRLEADHERIVLLGDIFQTDHGLSWGPAAARRQLRAAQRRVARLWARLSRSPYVYVHGNHDEIAAEACGAAEHWIADGAHPALFIHGHQYDPIARRTPVLADLGTWTCGRLRAVGLRPAARWLEGRDVAIKHGRFGGPKGPYAAGAETLVRRHHTPIVVMGHTHVAGIDELSDGRMANTGTCSGGAFVAVSVDTARGDVHVLRGADLDAGLH